MKVNKGPTRLNFDPGPCGRNQRWHQVYLGQTSPSKVSWGGNPVLTLLLETILSTVGQDCYTRLWSLKDGHLLRTIPSPHPAANDLIPSVVFSSKLGGCRGLPGLLMAVKHDLYYFPYNTDYQEGGEQPNDFYENTENASSHR